MALDHAVNQLKSDERVFQPSLPVHAVKQTGVDGDYLIVEIDVACSLTEIMRGISELMKPFADAWK